MVQPSPCEVVPQTGRKAAAGGSPYLGHPHEVAAAGVPSRPHRHAVAPAAPARAAKPPRSRSAYGVAAVISAVGEGVRCMARPPPGAARWRRGPAGARIVGIPRDARRGTGGWWPTARAWAAVGSVTPCQRVVAVPNGRVAVVSALILRSERNQGRCGARRGHADDVAAWFVSIGRLSPVPPTVECAVKCQVKCKVKSQERSQKRTSKCEPTF